MQSVWPHDLTKAEDIAEGSAAQPPEAGGSGVRRIFNGGFSDVTS